MKCFVREQVLLSEYTTLKVGGKARYFIEVETIKDLEEAGKFAKQTALPLLVIGGGSNLLISDESFDGVVILNRIEGLEYKDETKENVTLVVGAGEILDRVIEGTVLRGVWGLENLSSIPGTVGATPIQNVGAYGVEVSDFIVEVEAYHIPTNTKKIFVKDECNFGYRDSFFKTQVGKEYIVTAVSFLLSKIPKPKIEYSDLAKRFTNTSPAQKEIREAVIDIRSKKFPDWHVVGTAGSFFKNPVVTEEESKRLSHLYPDLPQYKTNNGLVKISLGYILDKICNLKGYREGNVSLYSEQALVLVNYGKENSVEIKEFVKKVTEKVFEETKIVIIPEVCVVD